MSKAYEQLLTSAPGIKDAINPPATDEEIKTAEDAIGVEFPTELKALYKLFNGQTEESSDSIIGGAHKLLSLKDAVREWSVWTGLLDDGTFNTDNHKAITRGGVKTDWWNKKWIPITSDGSGYSYLVDLDPAEDGTVGQITHMGPGDPERNVEASSIMEWFADKLEEVKRERQNM